MAKYCWVVSISDTIWVFSSRSKATNKARTLIGRYLTSIEKQILIDSGSLIIIDDDYDISSACRINRKNIE